MTSYQDRYEAYEEPQRCNRAQALHELGRILEWSSCCRRRRYDPTRWYSCKRRSMDPKRGLEADSHSDSMETRSSSPLTFDARVVEHNTRRNGTRASKPATVEVVVGWVMVVVVVVVVPRHQTLVFIFSHFTKSLYPYSEWHFDYN